jgi:hypothetical protein
VFVARSRPASSFRASLAEVFLHELTQLVGFFLAPVPRLFVFTSLGETPLVTARRRRPADYFRDLGPFRAQFRVLLEKWANEHGLAEDFMNGNYEFLFNRRQKQGGKGAHLPLSERRAFIEVARETPTRNAKQIYGWILRNMDKKSKSGKWQKEETEALLEQYTKLGPKWSKIAEIVGRPASACRDKWRLAKGGEHKKSGHWSQEETDKLCELVKEHFRQRGAEAGCGPGTGNEHLSLRDNINWVTISAKMGTRNEQACLQ